MAAFLNRKYHGSSQTYHIWLSYGLSDPGMAQTTPPFPIIQYSDHVILDKIYESVATQNETDIGTNNTKFISPLRLAQATSVLHATSWKEPCRVATTGNITLVGGAPNTVDGISVSVDDRILVWQQSTASQNGIYYVSTLGTGANGTWVRAEDFDNSDEVVGGMTVFSLEGSDNSRTRFILTTIGIIILNTTSLSFEPETPIVRTDATSTEIISATAFTTGIIWSSAMDMRDHREISVWFNPTVLGSNTSVDLYIQWSDDGSTVPFDDNNGIQQTDFLLTTGTDGTFKPKDYTARLTTTAPAELVANSIKMLSFPKKGGSMRFGVKGNNASGTFSVRAQRLA